jgi:hypothetical membrane protein
MVLIFDRFYSKFPIFIWGFLGIGIIGITSLITALFFTDQIGDPYSPIRFFISELGGPKVSQLAWVFNWGLIIGGIPITLFMFGLGIRFKSWFGYIACILGIFTSINCMLVGVFPWDTYLEQHIVTAMSFFYGGMFTVLLFSIVILFDKKHVISSGFSALGLLVASTFALFLFAPRGNSNFSIFEENYSRPAILWSAIFEWSVYFAILIWIGLISLVLMQQNKKK